MTDATHDVLASAGRQLAEELDKLAVEFHVKSGEHVLLLWEAAIVRAEVRNLTRGEPIGENLRDSRLDSETGGMLSRKFPDVALRVRRFHKAVATAVRGRRAADPTEESGSSR